VEWILVMTSSSRLCFVCLLLALLIAASCPCAVFQSELGLRAYFFTVGTHFSAVSLAFSR
jgi:hypothetical protein